MMRVFLTYTHTHAHTHEGGKEGGSLERDRVRESLPIKERIQSVAGAGFAFLCEQLLS